MGRDEVQWLLRHQYLHWYDPNKPAKLTKGMVKEDWMDKQLPELLFLIEELRSKNRFYLNLILNLLTKNCVALTRKYSQVIQRYHIEFLSGADTHHLNQHIEVNYNFFILNY